MRAKKILSFLVAVAIVIGMLPVTAFAAENTATTMRLAKTKGTVTVTNATDKVVKQTENMKLYNGYKLKTDAKSYAWLSLDDTKAAKLDANSEVSVQKSGNKLTLYLSSGSVFFNVKETLKGDESFNIKTSTMTMGIRGTSGCVSVVNPRVSEVHLLTGKVEVLVEHPELNISKSAILTAGNTATSLIDREAIEVSGQPVEIVIEPLDEETVCGNCATEIKEDVKLQERIEGETNLDVEEIIGKAEEKLEADEKAAAAKQETIDEAIAKQEFPEEVDPYFEEEMESGGGGGTGGTVPPAEAEVVSSWGELIEKILAFNAGTSDAAIELGANVPTADDLTQDLEPLPTIDNANGNTLTLNLSQYVLGLQEPLVNNGNLVITNLDGAIGHHSNSQNNYAVIENYGDLTLQNGAIVVGDGSIGINNYEGATFTMTGGSIVGGTIDIDANNELVATEGFEYDIEIVEGIVNNGEVSINGGTISGVITGIFNQGTGTVYISGGTISTAAGSCIAVDLVNGTATFTGGTINVPESAIGISVSSDSALGVNGGTINVTGAYGTAINNGGEANLAKGRINISYGLEYAMAVDNYGSLITDAIKIYARSGVGVSLNDGSSAEFGASTGIYGFNDANAVIAAVGDAFIDIARPVKANISAVKYNGTVNDSMQSNGVFYPLLADMRIEAGVTDADGTQSYKLVDEYGAANNPISFAQLVQNFNDGTTDETITLTNNVDMTTTAETLPAVMAGEAAAKILTVDLNGYTLTLADTWVNEGELVITDSSNSRRGQIIGTPDNALIENRGYLTWDEGTLIVTKEATTGIETSGTVFINGGTIKAEDTSLLNGNMIAVDVVDGGSLTMYGGSITAAALREDYPAGYTYYNVMALRNSGYADLMGGEITAITERSDAVSNIGEVIINGASIIAEGTESNGVYSTGYATMESGMVSATGDGSVAFTITKIGESLYLYGGTISAESETATAFASSDNENIPEMIDTTIRAKAGNLVWTGNIPVGYEVSAEMAEDGYYYLQMAEDTGNVYTVSDWETFTDAVTAFNSSDVIDTIRLEDNINGDKVTEEIVEAFPLANVNNVSRRTLTLDLDAYQLALPVILNADSPLIITGTSGSISADDQLLADSSLIAGSSITLEGGTIGVPLNYRGINTVDFTMSGGKIAASGGAGLTSSGDVVIEGGTIEVSEAGLGIDINSGTVSFSGATMTISEGIGVNGVYGEFEMTSGNIYVDGGEGITIGQDGYANLAGGAITVNSTIGEEMAVRISGGTLEMNGTDITVYGNEADVEFENYGIYDTSSDSNIDIISGSITAIPGAYNEVPTGNSYAIFGADTGWSGFTLYETGTVRSEDEYTVMVPMPDGYAAVINEDGYYYLENTMSAWANFVNQLYYFNESDSDQTIELTEDIIPTAADLEENGLPDSIGNEIGSVLTIDLGTYTLELPQTLNATGSPITIAGSTGSIIPSNLLETVEGEQTAMIYSGQPITLTGGSIIVPENYIGVETGEFELRGGTVVADGGTGIVGSSVQLTGGELNVNGGIGVDNAGGVIELSGATVNVDAGTGINLFQGFFTMSSGVMNVENGGIGVSNESTTDLYGGTINVEEGCIGIYNYENATTNITSIEMVVNGGTSLDTVSYGIYDQGGSLYIAGGTITAISGATDGAQDNEIGNAYALYTDYIETDPTDGSSYRAWADCTIEHDENDQPIAVIRSNVDNIQMMVDPIPYLYSYDTFTDGDYFKIVTVI